MKKVLIAYYSHSDTTHKVAERIGAVTGGDIFELQPVDAYPTDYNALVKQAKREISEGFKPELQSVPDISQYDVIFVGSPNWWSTIAPPVATFLSGQDFTGKVIAPFITHGGGGLGKSVADIKKLCEGASVSDGFNANQGDKMESWLKSLL